MRTLTFSLLHLLAHELQLMRPLKAQANHLQTRKTTKGIATHLVIDRNLNNMIDRVPHP